MNTYKITTTTGEVKLFTTSSTQGDLSNDEVTKAARDSGIIEDDDLVDTVEFWPGFDTSDTNPVTFHLMGRFEVPKGCKEHLDRHGNVCGFKFPDGSILRIQVVMERESPDGEEFEDLGTCDLEALGVVGFGGLDEKEIRIDKK